MELATSRPSLDTCKSAPSSIHLLVVDDVSVNVRIARVPAFLVHWKAMIELRSRLWVWLAATSTCLRTGSYSMPRTASIVVSPSGRTIWKEPSCKETARVEKILPIHPADVWNATNWHMSQAIGACQVNTSGHRCAVRIEEADSQSPCGSYVKRDSNLSGEAIHLKQKLCRPRSDLTVHKVQAKATYCKLRHGEQVIIERCLQLELFCLRRIVLNQQRH